MEVDRSALEGPDLGASGSSAEQQVRLAAAPLAPDLQRPVIGPDLWKQLFSPAGQLVSPCPLQHIFQQVLRLMQQVEDNEKQLDPCIVALMAFFLKSKTSLHASKITLGKLILQEPRKIETGLSVIAATLFHHSRGCRVQLEQAITQSDATLLLYLDLSRYDETPMKITQQEPLVVEAVSGADPGAQAGAAGDAGSSSDAAPQAQAFVAKSTTLSKLLATENRYAMVVRINGGPGDDDAPQHILMVGSSLTTLQILDRGTGANIKAALSDNMSISEAATKFGIHTRACTADLAPANAAAESLVQASRPDTWSYLRMPCNVHIVARCHTRVFQFLEHHISGLINFSLSLSQGTNMARFRRSLAKVLVESTPVQILRGTPPEAAIQYRNFVLQLFASTGTNVALKKYLLQRLPNGLWTRTDRVEVYVEPGIEVDEAKLQRQVITTLLICLCSKSFQTYPRHRWLGADIACDQVGLAESIHGLASAAYLRMQHEAGDVGGNRPRRAGTAAQASPTGAAAAATVEGHVPPAASTSSTGEAEALQPGQPDSAGGQGPPDVAEATGNPAVTFAEINAKRVRVASDWLRDQPLAHIMTLRLCLAPLRDLRRFPMEPFLGTLEGPFISAY